MGIGEKVWDALAAVIKMNEKIEALGRNSALMGAKLENLAERVIRLETALEIGIATGSRRLSGPRSKRE